MKQTEFIYNYNDHVRPKFNGKLFVRTDDELIDAMRKIIYSCERNNNPFTIKVLSFDVIDDYDEINRILWEYEDFAINKGKPKEQKPQARSTKTKDSKKINQFAFIQLQDSDLKLIKVRYFIQIEEKNNGIVNDELDVYIAIPRIVNDYYFRLNSNMYSAMYQIVDASTYNNSTARNSKKQSIIFKTIFMPIRMYRYSAALKDINGENIQCIYFLANMFKKSLLAMKYMLAKYGFYGTMNLLKIEGIDIRETVDDIDRTQYYIFPVRNLYIVVSKMIFDAIQVVQSFVYTMWSIINQMKSAEYTDFINDNIVYATSLGTEFASKTNLNNNTEIIYNKGLSILGSLEFIYDKITQEDLKLPVEDKKNIYVVLRWMMYEFAALRQKSNLNIATKKVRWAEYIAALYAAKLANGIYRISDKGDRADINTIKKALKTPPMYLINAIAKCQLVNYKNSVNDLDSIFALKYTYKGVSGIGEKSNAISQAYRSIDPSHLGRVDIDSSSNSDPGVSGTICPFVQLHDGHFSEYTEPNSWEKELSKLMDVYRAMGSRLETRKLIKDHGFSTNSDEELIMSECASIGKSLITIPVKAQLESQFINGVDLFGDGYFYLLNE